jgi:two-component system chemotaxis response regulator CheB
MKRVRVLIADDSRTVRDALTGFLSQQPDIELVGEARDGLEAVALATAHRPDVVTMDAQMPMLDGFSATEKIMSECPCRILMVCSLGETNQVEAGFRAMSAGALEVIAKPVHREDAQQWPRKIHQAILLMSEVPVLTRRSKISTVDPLEQLGGRVDFWGIAASTGGPPVLAQIFGGLPSDLPASILVAQHIAPGFTPGLIRWFSSTTPLKVCEATRGARPLPGHIYLAPDRCDMEIDAMGKLSTPPSPGGHCPSGNRLLQSLANAYGARAGGVVLTGMGEDGAEGLMAIHNAGGVTLAQDEATSAVFGMPAAAKKLGATRMLLPPEGLLQALRDFTRATWSAGPRKTSTPPRDS